MLKNENTEIKLRCSFNHIWYPFDRQVCSHNLLVNESPKVGNAYRGLHKNWTLYTINSQSDALKFETTMNIAFIF